MIFDVAFNNSMHSNPSLAHGINYKQKKKQNCTDKQIGINRNTTPSPPGYYIRVKLVNDLLLERLYTIMYRNKNENKKKLQNIREKLIAHGVCV